MSRSIADRTSKIVEPIGCRAADDPGRLTWATVWHPARRMRLTRDPVSAIGRAAIVNYTQAELRTEDFEDIEVFYNRQRRHSTLGQRSPADYENSTLSPARPIDAASRLASSSQIKFTAPTATQVA